jgi:hypothetical protein
MIIYFEIVMFGLLTYHLCKSLDKRTNNLLYIKEPLFRLIIFCFTFIPFTFIFTYITNYINEIILLPFLVIINMSILYFTIIKYLKTERKSFYPLVTIRHEIKYYFIPILLFLISFIIKIIFVILLYYKFNILTIMFIILIIIFIDIISIYKFIKINKK